MALAVQTERHRRYGVLLIYFTVQKTGGHKAWRLLDRLRQLEVKGMKLTYYYDEGNLRRDTLAKDREYE